jgi:hypothetical protein
MSGVGVRTVQRIESTGVASYESIQAIAAALDLPASELVEHPEPKNKVSIWHIATKRRVAVLISSLIVAIGLLVTNTVVADVKLDYSVSIEDQDAANNAVDAVRVGNQILSEGQSATILIDGLKIEVTPTVQQDGVQILLAVKIYEEIDGEYSLRAEPKVITADTEAATIRSNSSSGNLLSVFLTPSIQ